MERSFNVYRFSGLIQYKSKGPELKKMTLADCLKHVFNTSYDSDTERFFKNRSFSFELEELTLSELTDKIGKGLAVFPVSKLQRIEEVKSYIELGLDPVFMRAVDFRTFRKCYEI